MNERRPRQTKPTLPAAAACGYSSFWQTNQQFSFFVAECGWCAYSLVRISLAGAPIAQLDRALVYGTKGCRFNSCWARHFSASQTRDRKRGGSENLPRYLTTGAAPNGNGNYFTLAVANEPVMASPPPESVPSTQTPVIFPLTPVAGR